MKLKTLFSAMAALALLSSNYASAGDIRTQMMQNVIKIDPGKFKALAAMPLAVKGKGCTYYEHANGGGKSWKKAVAWQYSTIGNQTTYAEYVANVGSWWNDKISSVRCDDSANVHCYTAVYTNENKGGNEAAFAGQSGMINLSGSDWNDAISSYVVYCTQVK